MELPTEVIEAIKKYKALLINGRPAPKDVEEEGVEEDE